MAKILLFGLDHALADELDPVLKQLGQAVQVSSAASAILRTTDANVVFADGKDLGEIRGQRPELPVVVVSRIPEVRSWLDALEGGATDYCGAPFEATQVRWVLDTSLKASTRVAA